MTKTRSDWMFEDWPEGTTLRQFQILNTAILRLNVVILIALKVR